VEYGLVVNFKTNCLVYEIEGNMEQCKVTNKVEAELESPESIGHGFQETADHNVTQSINDESVWTKRKYVEFVNTLRTGSFKLFKRPLPGLLTILINFYTVFL